jgi:hypothetical protein
MPGTRQDTSRPASDSIRHASGPGDTPSDAVGAGVARTVPVAAAVVTLPDDGYDLNKVRD